MARTRTAVIARASSATLSTTAALLTRNADIATRATLDAIARKPRSTPATTHRRCAESSPSNRATGARVTRATPRPQVRAPGRPGPGRIDGPVVRRPRGEEPGECRAGALQLGRRPDLDEPALIQDGDEVGCQRQARSMRDGEDRPRTGQPIEQRHDRLLAGRVEVRRGFVEEQDAGVAEQRTGDREALPLATAEPGPALADTRVESARQVRDELDRRRTAAARPAARAWLQPGGRGGGCRRSSRGRGAATAARTRRLPARRPARGRRGRRHRRGSRPSSGSRNRSRRPASVDLPAPLGPTIVSRPPGRDRRTSRRRAPAITLRVLVAHAIEGDGRWSGTSLVPVARDATGTVGAGASRIANSRPAATWPALPAW